MTGFKLSNGATAWIDELNIYRTYSHVFFFKRVRYVNEMVFDGLKYPSSFGERNFVKIPPSEVELNSELHPYFYSVYLCSNHLLTPDSDGSGLVIMKTSKDFIPSNLRKFVQGMIDEVDWEKKAGVSRF